MKTIKEWLFRIRDYPNLKVAFDFLHKEHKEQSSVLQTRTKKLDYYKEKEKHDIEFKKFETFFTNKNPKKNIN